MEELFQIPHQGGRYVCSRARGGDSRRPTDLRCATTGGDALPAPRRRDRRGEVPATCCCAAGDRHPLRGEGESRTGPARGPARGGKQVRRRQPGGGGRDAVGRRFGLGPRSLQPRHPALGPDARGGAGGPVVRGRLLGGDREGCQRGPRRRRAVPVGHLWRGFGLALVVQVRLLDRTGGRGAALRGEGRAGRGGGLLPRGITAARSRRVGGADRGERPRVRAPRCRGVPAPAAGPRRWLPGQPGRRLPRPRDLRTGDRGVAQASISALGGPPPWSSRGAASPPTPVS